MAIATLEAFKNALKIQREFSYKYYTLTVTAGRIYDMFQTVASTPVVPTNATSGAVEFTNPTSGQLSLVGLRGSVASLGGFIFADRLSHQGGLSGNVSGNQTTNLPTAALTRYTSGEGVMLGLSLGANVGTTATTITASYTNSAGTTGRTTQAIPFGGTGNREGGRLMIMPLQDGDTGVRSVESVNLIAATGAVGNFGVVLFKPVFAAAFEFTSSLNSVIGFLNGSSCGGIPNIENDACLFPIVMSDGGSAQSVFSFQFAEN